MSEVEIAQPVAPFRERIPSGTPSTDPGRSRVKPLGEVLDKHSLLAGLAIIQTAHDYAKPQQSLSQIIPKRHGVKFSEYK